MSIVLDQNTIPNRIRLVRTLAGMTQQDFAERVGVHKNTVGNWERGEGEPDLSSASAICREFDVSAVWLMNGDGDMQQKKQLGISSRREDQPSRAKGPDAFVLPKDTDRTMNTSILCICASILMAADHRLTPEGAIDDARSIYAAIADLLEEQHS